MENVSPDVWPMWTGGGTTNPYVRQIDLGAYRIEGGVLDCAPTFLTGKPGRWKCPWCGNIQDSERTKCHECGGPKW